MRGFSSFMACRTGGPRLTRIQITRVFRKLGELKSIGDARNFCIRSMIGHKNRVNWEPLYLELRSNPFSIKWWVIKSRIIRLLLRIPISEMQY